ncbi:uracil-DNA glycosylase [Paenarthrobacter sp. DKR-5]|uniref:uracil-DNA glycosylase n=1 Tax=Paenarthrobacter sp. DKR-5 TaxID=2835535 RepID=UPI001BDC72AE|nr:uracil-DNA glycosylase [Paenarthrobacter sp. DKR-5]MBT1004336.1 uracil-DNA glycosylase [Paenarthrobacter sp. DKR-5]
MKQTGTAGRTEALFDLQAQPPAAEEDTSARAALAEDPLSLMAPDWAEALAPVEDRLRAAGRFAAAQPAILPAAHNVLRAFTSPLSDVKVLIVGQDPYPTPGHAIGLAFAVDGSVRPLPRSLANIYQELQTDLGLPPAPHGDLSAWTAQGVLLLNRVLTVAPGAAGSHRRKGWEEVTSAAIAALAARGGPLVAILWGNDAGTVAPLLAGVPLISSAHPSPLSARRGFFGSRPFSRANELLAAQGAAGVDWSLPGQ